MVAPGVHPVHRTGVITIIVPRMRYMILRGTLSARRAITVRGPHHTVQRRRARDQSRHTRGDIYTYILYYYYITRINIYTIIMLRCKGGGTSKSTNNCKY